MHPSYAHQKSSSKFSASSGFCTDGWCSLEVMTDKQLSGANSTDGLALVLVGVDSEFEPANGQIVLAQAP